MESSESSQTSNAIIHSKQNQSLVQTTSNLSRIEDYREYIDTLIAAKSLPSWVTSPEVAFMIIEYGKSKGFPTVDCFNFVTPVKGVMSVNAKGVGYLMHQAGYVIKEVHRAAFIYSANGKEYISPRKLAPDEVAWKLEFTPEEWSALSETKMNRVATARDRVTTIKYGFRQYDNSISWEGEFSYYLSNAIDSGLAGESGKDTYALYLPDMMLHRAKVGVSKVLGVLTGSESEELSQVKNTGTIEIMDGDPMVIDV